MSPTRCSRSSPQRCRTSSPHRAALALPRRIPRLSGHPPSRSTRSRSARESPGERSSGPCDAPRSGSGSPSPSPHITGSALDRISLPVSRFRFGWSKGEDMIPGSFDYHAPRTLAEAVALLGQHGEDAKVLSGGQSLLPLLKLRLGSAGHLVDIGKIPDLEYIREEGGFLKIGGRTRETALEHSDLIRKKYHILADTAAVIADPLVRNLATVGGNLAHGDPANDHPATMMALAARVVATGPKGARTIPIDQFFTGLFSTALAPDEILTEIQVPVPPPKSGG